MSAGIFIRGAGPDGEGSHFATVPLESAYADILNRYVADHWTDIEDELRNAGYAGEPIIQPTWERFATIDDIAITGSPESQREFVAELVARANRTGVILA